MKTYTSTISPGRVGEVGVDFHSYLMHWVSFECASRSLHCSCDDEKMKETKLVKDKSRIQAHRGQTLFHHPLDSAAEENRQWNGFFSLPNTYLC